MKIAVVGASGQLGTELVRVFSDSEWDLTALSRPAFDISNVAAARTILNEIRPAVIVNTAAFTRVDDCEENARTAFDVNTHAVRNLAQASEELGSVLVHISTDYVFGGEKRTPYREDDTPNPLSVYGVSKLAGEYFVRAICPRHVVVRTSGLYGAAGSRGKGGNFVETMIRMAREERPIRVVTDQVLTPTYARDLAQTIKRLILTEARGLYHATNGGACSWYEFATRIFERAGLAPDFGPTNSEEFGARARRPAYSVLGRARLLDLGIGGLRPWTEALDAYLAEQGYG